MELRSHAVTPEDRYVLMIGLGLAPTDEIDLRLPLTVERELLAILDEEAIHYSRIIEFSAGGGDWAAYSVAVGTTSVAIWRLSRALATFLGRHKGKSVKVNLRGKTFEAKGYSVEESWDPLWARVTRRAFR